MYWRHLVFGAVSAVALVVVAAFASEPPIDPAIAAFVVSAVAGAVGVVAGLIRGERAVGVVGAALLGGLGLLAALVTVGLTNTR